MNETMCIICMKDFKLSEVDKKVTVAGIDYHIDCDKGLRKRLNR